MNNKIFLNLKKFLIFLQNCNFCLFSLQHLFNKYENNINARQESLKNERAMRWKNGKLG